MTKPKLNKAQEKRFDKKFPGPIHHSHETHLGANCKLILKQHLADELSREREKVLRKVRKGKIFVSSYGCIDCHELIPNTCDRCRRLRSS